MKKYLIIGTIILSTVILILGGIKFYNYYRIKHATVIINLKENLEAPFLSTVKVSDFIENINGKIINDYLIDTKTIGPKVIDYEYINDENIKLKESYTINVVDKVAPIVWLSGSYSVNVGSTVNLTEKIMCGDNYDNNPTCEVIGEYDMNTAGTYPLTFKATDSSGNITEKKFNLYVKKPVTSSNNSNPTTPSTQPKKTLFSDVVKDYKTSNTEIGLDISEFQGVVDYEKLKNAGVEFVILRVGSTRGIKGDYYLDDKFKENITKANAANMPVGIYFYSYANSKDKAIKDAKWVLEQIKDYQVDLPIAFDWENWSFYNEFNLSFFGLTDMANSFLNVFKSAGYEGMLYSSKTYLEQIWLDTNYPTWLAHYTKQTSYAKDYDFWQLCSDGKVDGINGDVDIDIRYKK